MMSGPAAVGSGRAQQLRQSPATSPGGAPLPGLDSGSALGSVPPTAGTDGRRGELIAVATAGFLGRYRGQSRAHTASDLRAFLTWCTGHELDPLDPVQLGRAQVEAYVRWMQEIRGFQPSTVSRRVSVVAGFYRTAVIDGLVARSPVEHVRRPRVPAESPTLGLSHLQFEAMLVAARQLTQHRAACRPDQPAQLLGPDQGPAPRRDLHLVIGGDLGDDGIDDGLEQGVLVPHVWWYRDIGFTQSSCASRRMLSPLRPSRSASTIPAATIASRLSLAVARGDTVFVRASRHGSDSTYRHTP
jgi:hypothetical protein